MFYKGSHRDTSIGNEKGYIACSLLKIGPFIWGRCNLFFLKNSNKSSFCLLSPQRVKGNELPIPIYHIPYI